MIDEERKKIRKVIVSLEEKLRFFDEIAHYGYQDLDTALEKCHEVNLDFEKLGRMVKDLSEETETPIEDIDICAVIFDHILEKSNECINHILEFDLRDADFYTAGNYCATTFDVSSEGLEKFQKRLDESTEIQKQMLLKNIFVKVFLEDNDLSINQEKVYQSKKEIISIKG